MRRCCLYRAAAVAGGGSRRAPRCSPTRATGGAPRSPTCSTTGGPARALLCAALVSVADRQSKSTDILRAFSAESDRALLSRSGHGLPGLLGSPRDVLRGGRSRPNTREIKSLRVDLGPLACALPPDAGCMLPFGLFVVCGGGSPRGAVLAAFAPSWRCPQSSLFLFYKIQLSTGSAGGIGATP